MKIVGRKELGSLKMVLGRIKIGKSRIRRHLKGIRKVHSLKKIRFSRMTSLQVTKVESSPLREAAKDLKNKNTK